MVKMMQEAEVMRVVEIIYLGSIIQRRRGWVEVIVRWSEVLEKKGNWTYLEFSNGC